MSKPSIEKRREKWRRAIIRVVKASREDVDLSRKQLADALGWTDQVMSNIENMRRALAAEDLILIAEALRIEPAELVRRIQRW